MVTKATSTDGEVSSVTLTVPVDHTATKETTAAFLKASGYKETDILDSNESHRQFVTKNGGKYRLSAKGGKVFHLAGPQFPNQEPESGE